MQSKGEVIRSAGVSVSIVSRVINNRITEDKET